MLLNAGCRLTFTVQYPTPIVLLLAARPGQAVTHEQLVAHPAVPMADHADLYGNRCHRLTAPPGTFSLTHYITAQSTDKLPILPGAPFCLIDQLPDEALPYLLPSRYCPSDHKELIRLANSIVTGQRPGYDQAEAIRHWIRANVRYEYGRSSSRTSALDTVRDRVGVCRDFTHLGIALCRTLNLPARMVAGYLYDLKPMDLHAWFEVYVGNAWYAFDATQAMPRGNRIPLAIGRDAVDVAFLTQFGPTTLDLMEVWVRSAQNEASPDTMLASGDASFVR
jgi:transglutaminase-like putative cysteine protease